MPKYDRLGYNELCRSEGLEQFPKEYPVKMSWGFFVYMMLLAVLVIYASLVHPFVTGVGIIGPVLLFDIVYFGAIFTFICCQLPIAVVRERECIIVRFCCRRRVIPIYEITEIRIVSASSCSDQMSTFTLRKCFWGFPTRMDKSIFITTDTCCNNYQLGLIHMEDFLTDNQPRDVEATTFGLVVDDTTLPVDVDTQEVMADKVEDDRNIHIEVMDGEGSKATT